MRGDWAEVSRLANSKSAHPLAKPLVLGAAEDA